MDERLAQLISDYQRAVGTAVLLMSESGFKIPSNIDDFLNLDIPAQGELNGGITYIKHGYGCWVNLPEGEVDFDLGPLCEIDGFDEWRLWNFCSERLNKYAFDTQQVLADCIRDALNEKTLAASSHDLYYVVDSVNKLGQEASRILTAGCALPHWTRDCVLTLYSQCFCSADLMLELHDAILRRLIKDQKLSQTNKMKFRVYLHSWIGYLHSTVKGFEVVGMRNLLQNKRPSSFLKLISMSDKLGKLKKLHCNDLRDLRNEVFHLRTSEETFRRFFDDDGKRMEWARELHAAFAAFFSDYRVLAEEHYLLNGRSGESQIWQAGERRRKQKADKAEMKR
ncbi:DUF6896 domain-containing protein [Uliginosibacterium gangwonense]|uniref:DUF6896 domain-containing protein n=1 Tax=Uliginosibacterium gangwonense TaxID=392736 RepID=UPI00037F6937|nr:hypothetical protein [Uliginosibacterium gangwonense]